MSNVPLSHVIWGVMRLIDAKLSSTDAATMIHKAIELGVTSFDVADIYGKYRVEESFGKCLREASEPNRF